MKKFYGDIVLCYLKFWIICYFSEVINNVYGLQVDETLKKKRTFRKFTFRGVDLDQLLDMPK